MIIEKEDIIKRYPRVMSPQEVELTGLLIEDSLELIESEFGRAGRDLDKEIEENTWLKTSVKRVVREMVTTSLLIGDNAGVKSITSTTGSESDTITYMDNKYPAYSGVFLTSEQRRLLGLYSSSHSIYKSRPAFKYPEVVLHGRRDYC